MIDSDTSSMKSGSRRRPSVDTVSTYLSHESNKSDRSRMSQMCGSVSDLLDCSLGSDDVFSVGPPPPPRPMSRSHRGGGGGRVVDSSSVAGSIVGVDPASDMISRFVKVTDPPQWPNAHPCPMCMTEMRHNPQNPAISLIRCQHLMHLECLNELIINQQKENEKVGGEFFCEIFEINEFSFVFQLKFTFQTLYIECPVCGIVYGEKIGNQPNGTMSWVILPKSLPGHDGQNTIQIVYK